MLALIFLVGCFSDVQQGDGGEGDSSSPATTPRFAYVTNYYDDSVSTYVVDAVTGRLKFIGKASSGLSPSSVTVDPLGRYAYVANGGSDNVSQYTINLDGSLSPMTPPSVGGGNSPRIVAVDPSGKYAYMTNQGSTTISQYTIGENGSLLPMTTATVPAGASPAGIVTTGTWQ